MVICHLNVYVEVQCGIHHQSSRLAYLQNNKQTHTPMLQRVQIYTTICKKWDAYTVCVNKWDGVRLNRKIPSN